MEELIIVSKNDFDFLFILICIFSEKVFISVGIYYNILVINFLKKVIVMVLQIINKNVIIDKEVISEVVFFIKVIVMVNKVVVFNDGILIVVILEILKVFQNLYNSHVHIVYFKNILLEKDISISDYTNFLINSILFPLDIDINNSSLPIHYVDVMVGDD